MITIHTNWQTTLSTFALDIYFTEAPPAVCVIAWLALFYCVIAWLANFSCVKLRDCVIKGSCVMRDLTSIYCVNAWLANYFCVNAWLRCLAWCVMRELGNNCAWLRDWSTLRDAWNDIFFLRDAWNNEKKLRDCLIGGSLGWLMYVFGVL